MSKTVNKCIFLWVILMCFSTWVHSQSKGLDLNFYLSKSSFESFDTEFSYVSTFASPLKHFRLGGDIYLKNRNRLTLHLGTVLVNELYLKPSRYEGFARNTPEDSIYRKKTKNFSYFSIGLEYRKLFQDNGRGIFLSIEPQVSYLGHTNEHLIIRNKNVLVLNEKREFRKALNNFNAVFIFGGGYEFKLLKKLNIMLGLHLEFRPLWGYYKNDNHVWVSRGISVGVRYLY